MLQYEKQRKSYRWSVSIKKIAVLLSGVGLENQNKAVNGILDSALQDEANVYIFTCDRWKYESRTIYEKGEYNI